MNPFKHLPKIHKRDKTSNKLVFYTALIDNVPSPQFQTKLELIDYIRDYSLEHVIKSLFMSKTTVETLIH